ncbi:hypothetical protein [Novosphingobium guangzhouense]|nr:hypothetical protein [Novosphingobium guangzhouense]
MSVLSADCAATCSTTPTNIDGETASHTATTWRAGAICKPRKDVSLYKSKTFEQVARAWHANRLSGLDEAHASRLLRRLSAMAFWRSAGSTCAR